MKGRTRVVFSTRHFDDVAILAVMAKVAISSPASLEGDDYAVLAALKRANPELQPLSVDEVGARLSAYEDDQIPGLVSNVKGVLHEMEFARLENADGDTIHAALFPATNHPDTDVLFHDAATGREWEAQLKATDSPSYVRDWLEEHPNGEILVTRELADKLHLPSTGLANDELTYRVEDVVDRLVSSHDETVWTYFPYLTTASVALVIWELWRRHREGKISREEFKSLAVRAAGHKVLKLGLISVLLSIPVVNVVTGAVLVARLIMAARDTGSRLVALAEAPAAANAV